MVEQLTLNQWVQGSNPCASTTIKKDHESGLFFIVFDEYDWFEIVGNAVAGRVRVRRLVLHRKIFAQIDLFYTWVGGDFTGGAFL